MKKYTQIVLASCITAVQLASSVEALAVGGGLKFEVDESLIPANVNLVEADSMDFTYHACTRIGGPNNDRLKELGYFLDIFLSECRQCG